MFAEVTLLSRCVEWDECTAYVAVKGRHMSARHGLERSHHLDTGRGIGTRVLILCTLLPLYLPHAHLCH